MELVNDAAFIGIKLKNRTVRSNSKDHPQSTSKASRVLSSWEAPPWAWVATRARAFSKLFKVSLPDIGKLLGESVKPEYFSSLVFHFIDPVGYKHISSPSVSLKRRSCKYNQP